MRKLGPNWAAFLKLVGIYSILFLLFRLVFFGYFFNPEGTDSSTAANYLKAMVLGSRFDLRVAVISALPLLILSPLPLISWRASAIARRFWLFFQTFITLWLLLVFAFDFGHYAYLQSRITVAVLENLRNPEIAGQMLRQTYNLPLIALGLGLLTVIIYLMLRKWILVPTIEDSLATKTRRWRNGFLCLSILLTLYGSFSQYPLRWSAAFFSANNFLSNLALNPVHYFVDTIANPDTSYDEALVQKYIPDLKLQLDLPNADSKSNPFRRKTIKVPGVELPKDINVIYIVMESYAAAKMHLLGNLANASPVMDSLAQKSWFFSNYYTPTEGTARSMFCTVTGLTDISADSTSSRNPRVVNQNSLINALTKHQKLYFLGGSAAWGNIRGVFQNNIQDLEIFEEEDFNLPKTDVWGLSDLDLFRESAKVIKAKAAQGPFFALIQSASFHRPYTIPADHGDFKIQSLSDEELKRFGFGSNDEYNSFRFSDYSLGEFFKAIENEAFFNNTVFVIHGDHGLPHKEAQHLGKGYKLFSLSRFHVPLVIYSKKLGAPKRIDKMVSQMDVMPSLLGLMGYEVDYQGLGHNFFIEDETPEFVFSYVYYDRPVTKFVYDHQFLVSTDRNGGIAGLFDYTSDTPDADLRTQYPERFEKMTRLLHGYFESSRYLVHHNPKIDYNPQR